jgi:Legume-like lectin family
MIKLALVLLICCSCALARSGDFSLRPYHGEDPELHVNDDWLLSESHSMAAPFSGTRHGVAHWQHDGATVLMDDLIRLTPLASSRTGRIFNEVPVALTQWAVAFGFRITGGRRGADGLAMWYKQDLVSEGSAFGAQSRWKGLAIAVDTFDNDNDGHTPLLSVLYNDGQREYNAATDGAELEIGSCVLPKARNSRTPVSVWVLYRDGGALQVLVQMRPDLPLELCTEARVDLPTGYHFAFSASTGGLADKHDIYWASVYNVAPGREDHDVLNAKHDKHGRVLDSDGKPIDAAADGGAGDDDAGAVDDDAEPHVHSANSAEAEEPEAPDHEHTEPAAGGRSSAAFEKWQRQRQAKQDDEHLAAAGGDEHSANDADEDEEDDGTVGGGALEAQRAVERGGDGIASKEVAASVDNMEMSFFKFKKRFTKVRKRLQDVQKHGDDHEDGEIELPESGREEPLLDDLPPPANIEELYEALAEEVWLIKTMQHDTMKLFKQLEDMQRHSNEHLEDQHRIFAESFSKLLREVATRHTVEDALKEQLLRFEQQSHDLRQMNSDFVENMRALRGEFESVSQMVRAKVGANHEIVSAQVAEIVKGFGQLQGTVSSLQGTVTSLAAASGNANSAPQYQQQQQQQYYRQHAQPAGSQFWDDALQIGSVFFYSVLGVVGCLLCCCCVYVIRARRKRASHRRPSIFD